jgi:hypothetical protein
MIYRKRISDILVFTLVCAFILGAIGCSGEKAAWEEAQKAGTIQAYEEFLKTHPEGEFAASAKTRIGEIHLTAAEQANTVTAYEEFLKLHPDGDLAEKARAAIETLNPSFKTDEVVAVESIPATVWGGEVVFQKVDEEGFIHFTMTGTVKVTGDAEEFPFFCAGDIELPAGMKLPAAVFSHRGLKGVITTKKSVFNKHLKTTTVTVKGKKYNTIKRPFEVDRLEMNPVHAKVKADPAGDIFIVAGPAGVKLKKEDNGFILVEGAAKLLNKKLQ